ncbi:MAG: Ig-like domain-containing protein [Bacteroidales bacterium]
MKDYDGSWNIIPHSEDGDHIGEVGALRLAKAMWWLLARIAGWDGGEGSVPVTGITVTGEGGATTITRDNGTLALTATVTPANATNKSVTWSIIERYRPGNNQLLRGSYSSCRWYCHSEGDS